MPAIPLLIHGRPTSFGAFVLCTFQCPSTYFSTLSGICSNLHSSFRILSLVPFPFANDANFCPSLQIPIGRDFEIEALSSNRHNLLEMYWRLVESKYCSVTRRTCSRLSLSSHRSDGPYNRARASQMQHFLVRIVKAWANQRKRQVSEL